MQAHPHAQLLRTNELYLSAAQPPDLLLQRLKEIYGWDLTLDDDGNVLGNFPPKPRNLVLVCNGTLDINWPNDADSYARLRPFLTDIKHLEVRVINLDETSLSPATIAAISAPITYLRHIFGQVTGIHIMIDSLSPTIAEGIGRILKQASRLENLSLNLRAINQVNGTARTILASLPRLTPLLTFALVMSPAEPFPVLTLPPLLYAFSLTHDGPVSHQEFGELLIRLANSTITRIYLKMKQAVSRPRLDPSRVHGKPITPAKLDTLQLNDHAITAWILDSDLLASLAVNHLTIPGSLAGVKFLTKCVEGAGEITLSSPYESYDVRVAIESAAQRVGATLYPRENAVLCYVDDM